MSNQVRTAILGASGYTGVELLRLLLRHPHADIKALTADSQAGKRIDEVFPHLHGSALPVLRKHEEIDWAGIDCVFACLPHGTSQTVLAALPAHLRIIDLSADFRLSDPAQYAEWYGHPHQALALQQEAVYGLTEHYRDQIHTARLIANPGCYPTSALLPLLPLLDAKLIDPARIVIDAKSGISGAGRALKTGSLFCEADENVAAYGIGAHRHTPEIEQELACAAGLPVTIRFTPHLIPMRRGMLSTIYVEPSAPLSALRECLETRYADEPFVHVLPEGSAPATAHVAGTNQCRIGLFEDRKGAILISAIDNLAKGASGQAVQNFNRMFGYPETVALEMGTVFP